MDGPSRKASLTELAVEHQLITARLSVVVTDLLGSSGLRILQALANGETDAKSLASLGDDRLKCPEEQLVEALTGRSQPMHREVLALPVGATAVAE
jgi:transposase